MKGVVKIYYKLNPNFSIINFDGSWIFTSLENSSKNIKIKNINSTWINIFKELNENSINNKIQNNISDFLIQNSIISKSNSQNSTWLVSKINYVDYTNSEIAMKIDKKRMKQLEYADSSPSIIKNFKEGISDVSLDSYMKTYEISLSTIFEVQQLNNSLNLERLAKLLYFTCGAQRKASFHNIQEILLKTYPSNGARHVLNSYIISNNMEWINNGVFYYHPLKNKLIKIANVTPLGHRQLYIIITCDFSRMQWRYRNSWMYRDILFEYGHFIKNFDYMCKGLGLTFSYKNTLPCDISTLNLDVTEEIYSILKMT